MRNFLRVDLYFYIILSCLLFSCDQKKYVQGERIYTSFCANCHMEDGQGLSALIPPLANSDYYLEHYSDLSCIITNGMSGKITVNGREYDEEMIAVQNISHAELSNLINYMNSQWYPDKAEVNMKTIEEQLRNCAD